MLPRSDDLEGLVERGKQLLKKVKPLGSGEIHKTEIKEAAASIAREWIRYSQALRQAGVCDATKLEAYDQTMQQMLGRVSARVRASALRKDITVLVDGAVDDIIVPLIKYEGSPRQVAARQLLSAFDGLSADETTYLGEAARCLTVQCHRAAVIMLWTAAIARLHAAITQKGFAAFNAAVDAAIAKKGQPFNRIKDGTKISSVAELQRSKDADLLIVGMELFGYDLQVYQELDRLLGTRNDSAHPGMAEPGVLDVQQFANKVNSYVFQMVKI
jgi:hypothetical protein